MNKKHAYLLVILIGFFATSCSLSDNERKMVREGNKAYKDSIFDEAEILYRKALDYNPTSFAAHYNIANATYKQENYKDAVKKYNRLLDSLETKEWKSASLHNLGNSYLHIQKIDKAIEAYKKSLRENPNDKETKYNLVYAMKLREKQNQQQQQQQQNQNQQKQEQQGNKNKQDQKSQQDNQPKDGDKETKPQPKPGEGKGDGEEKQQEQQEGEKKEDNKKSKEDQNKETADEQENDKAPEPSTPKDGNPDEKNGEKLVIPAELSKKDAENLLDAIAVEEKESQEKVQKDKARKKGSVKNKKNW